MLTLFNIESVKIGLLENLKDFVILEKLKNGSSTISFSLYRNDPYCKQIKEECYIETSDNRYIVKMINDQQTVIRYTCELDLESLTSKIWSDGFNNTRANVIETIKLAIAGTGWTVIDGGVNKKNRTINLKAMDSYEIITNCLTKWDVEIKIDAKKRIIRLADKIGEDKGCYFTDELNLTTINVESNSRSFATRLYVKGKDGLTFASINGGKDYIEDYSYSSKLVSKIWIDERYENAQQLLEDARLKLNDYCKPKSTYELEVIDLAELSEDYSFLEYTIGDSVTLLSFDKEIREVHRIVEMAKYPLEPERNTATLSNGFLTFEEAQEKNEAMADSVDSVLNEDGTLNGSKVDGITTEQIIDFEAKVGSVVDLSVVNAKIDNLEVNKASVAQLSAVQADIGDLRVNTATIDQLKVTEAKISVLEANDVKVNGLLEASSAKINVLEATSAEIKHLLAGNISSINIQTGGITSDKLTIATGFIKDAMIDSLNANKITAGQINTALVNIASSSGNLVINDNTIQIRDNSRVRVQIGKDASNDYSMSVWDSSGQLMFDARGLKANAIKDSIIRNDMISSGANIDGSKLNISSVVSSINNGTSTLKASKVQFDGIAQTLEVAFNSLKTNVEGIEIGGRNLWFKTKEYNPSIDRIWRDNNVINGGLIGTSPYTTINGFGVQRIALAWRDISQQVEIESNTEYVLSAWIKSENPNALAKINPYAGVPNTDGSSVVSQNFISNENLSATEYKRYWFVFTTNGSISQCRFESSNDNPYLIYGLKLEKGNKATDWTPAPEDVDGLIESVKQITESNTTAINVAQGKINTLIQDTTIVKDGVGTKLKDEYSKLEQTVSGISTTIGKQQTTIDDHTGKITATNSELSTLKQSVDGISADVSSAETMIQSHTTQIGQKANSIDVYTRSQTDAQINLAKDSINLGISTMYETKESVSTKLNSLQIGGRNLLKMDDVFNYNSTTFNKEAYAVIFGANSSSSGVRFPSQLIKAGKPYVLTYKIKKRSGNVRYLGGHNSHSDVRFYLDNVLQNSSYASGTVYPDDNLEHIVRLHFRGDTPSDPNVYIQPNRGVGATEYIVEVYDMQLVEGDKESGWQPAPEDVTSDIERAKLEAITGANNATAEVLEDYYNRVETNAAINVAKEEINLGVSTNYETKTNVTSKINTAKNESAADAQNKVNAAKTELNTSINKKANSADVYTKTETYTKGETDSKIKLAKESIELGVSSKYETKENVENKVTTAVSNIVVGGRNLATGTKTLTGWSGASGYLSGKYKGFDVYVSTYTAGSNYKDLQKHNCIEPEPDTEYTLSFWAKGSGTIRCFLYPDAVASGINSQGRTTTAWDGNITFTLSADWCRYWVTWRTRVAVTGAKHLIACRQESTDSVVNLCGVMFEKGNKASDWLLAPEDTSADIATAKTEAINTAASDATGKVNSAKNDLTAAINLKAGKTDVYTKTETYTKSETDSAIRISKESIELGVSSKYETKENVESKVSTVTTEVKGYTDAKVSDISYGGRNFQRNGAPYNTYGWNSAGIGVNHTVIDEATAPNSKAMKVTLLASGTGGAHKPPIRKLTPGQKYAWSVYIKGSKTMTMQVGMEQGGQKAVQVTTDWQRFTHTFTANNSSYSSFTFYAQNVAANDYYLVHSLMVEEGTLPSPWKPAPEDTTADIDAAKSELTNSINLKASKTDVYTKTETYSKGETDSAINVAKDSINLGVSQNYETKTNVTSKVSQAVVDARKIPDTRNANENPLWYFHNYPKQTITEFKFAHVIGIGSSTNTYYGTLTTVVPWSESSGGYPVQTFRSQSYPTYERRGTSNTGWSAWIQIENSADAQAKADAAKNSAISSANSTLTITIANYYTKSQTDSQINIAKDAINLGVSSTYETKVDVTTKINGVNSSISALQQRVATAEQKITDSAIITTVKSQFYTKMETDAQITSKGYATTSQLEQTSNSLTVKFTESGGYNCIRNSGFLHAFTFWGTQTHNSPTGGTVGTIGPTSDWGFPNTRLNTAQIKLSNQSSIEYGLKCAVDTTVGKTYTLRFRYAAHRVSGGNAIVRSDSGGWLASKSFNPGSYSGGKGDSKNWGTLTLNFTATSTSHTLNIVITSAQNDGYMWIAEPMVFEGSVDSPYSPHPSETYWGQTLIDQNGIRVNASNVGTYTEMHAGGFFVKKNDGNLLFEATNKIALYDGKGTSCISIVNDPSASYGNARIDLRGGINFIHNPGVSVGTNQILLGNHDVSNQYGMHNVSIRCHNSMGIQDNYGYTNMFVDARRGRWIMKGALYQNTATPPATFSMNFIGEDDVYDSGYEKQEVIDSVMKLRTGVYVDNDGECCTSIWGGLSDLLTTDYMDDDGNRTLHLNTQALNAALVVMLQQQQERIIELENKLLN